MPPDVFDQTRAGEAPPGLRVLRVGTDPRWREPMRQALAGQAVESAASADAALERLGADPTGIGAVVADLRLPDGRGPALLEAIVGRDADLPVILVVGGNDATDRMDWVRRGAHEVIEAPICASRSADSVRRALDRRSLVLARRSLARDVETLASRLDGLLAGSPWLAGRSATMRHVRRRVIEVAASPVDALIVGEVGSGTQQVARRLHDLSERTSGPFVAIHCGGMSEARLDAELFGVDVQASGGAGGSCPGRIEQAHGGTLFVGELGAMPWATQARLLGALRTRRVARFGSAGSVPSDVRIVASIEADPARPVDAPRLHPELLERFGLGRIDLPSLRDRGEDLPALYRDFLSRAADRHDRPLPAVDDASMRRLIEHAAPGHLDALRHAADCHVLDGTQAIDPTARRFRPSLARAVDLHERRLVIAAWRRRARSVPDTAQALNLPRTTLYDKLRKHRID